MTSASRPSWPSGPAVPRTRIRARPRICSRAGWLPAPGVRRSRVAESGERTAAEREAARLERERRRQGRLAERASPAEPASPSSEADGDGDGADHEWDGVAVRTE